MTRREYEDIIAIRFDGKLYQGQLVERLVTVASLPIWYWGERTTPNATASSQFDLRREVVNGNEYDSIGTSYSQGCSKTQSHLQLCRRIEMQPMNDAVYGSIIPISFKENVSQRKRKLSQNLQFCL